MTLILIVYLGIAISVASLVYEDEPDVGAKKAIKEGFMWPLTFIKSLRT